MDKVLFHMFSDDRFMDLTLYQYGYEQCLPLHSYGPFVRNHFLFHYVISGKGTLLVDDENSQSTEYQLQGGMGFPDRARSCKYLFCRPQRPMGICLDRIQRTPGKGDSGGLRSFF